MNYTESGMPYFDYHQQWENESFASRTEIDKIARQKDMVADRTCQFQITSLIKGLGYARIRDETDPISPSYFKTHDTHVRDMCTHCRDGEYIVETSPDGVMTCPICARKWTEESSKKYLDMLLYLHANCVDRKLVVINEHNHKMEQMQYYDNKGRIIGKQTEYFYIKTYRYTSDSSKMMIVEKLNFNTFKIKVKVKEVE